MINVEHLPMLTEAITNSGVLIDGLSVDGTVTPSRLQKAAQPIIDAFDPVVAEKQRQIDQAKTLPLRDKAVILAVAEVMGVDPATLIAKVEAHITTEAAKT